MLKQKYQPAPSKSSSAKEKRLIVVRVSKYKILLSAATVAAVASCSGSDPRFVKLDPLAASPAAEVPATDIVIDRDAILASHNVIRNTLGIPPLSWSTNMEALAAGWANFLTTDAACTVRRRGTIGLPAHKNGVGENIRMLDAQRWDNGGVEVAAVDENDVVVDWARQALDYDPKSNECAPNKDCENFKQVVWRDSQVLGCAAASCPGKQQIWVCNYDPPGNFVGQKPY